MSGRGLCLEPVLLTARELAVVRGLVEAGASVEPLLSCVLEAGHGLEHAALADRTALDMHGPGRWLRWWPGRRVLETLPFCGEACPDIEQHADLAACVHPAGHEGGHSFDLDDPMDPSPWPERVNVADTGLWVSHH